MTAEFVSKQLDNLEEGLKSLAGALYADLSKKAVEGQRELFSKCGEFDRLALMQRSHELFEPVRQSGSYDRCKDNNEVFFLTALDSLTKASQALMFGDVEMALRDLCIGHLYFGASGGVFDYFKQSQKGNAKGSPKKRETIRDLTIEAMRVWRKTRPGGTLKEFIDAALNDSIAELALEEGCTNKKGENVYRVSCSPLSGFKPVRFGTLREWFTKANEK